MGAFVAVVLAVDVSRRTRPWSLEWLELAAPVVAVVIFTVGFSLARWWFRRGDDRGHTSMIVGILAAVAGGLAYAVLTRTGGGAPLAGLMIAVAGGTVAVANRIHVAAAVLLSAALGVGSAGYVYQQIGSKYLRPIETSTRILSSSLYALEIVHHDEQFPQVSSGGGFVQLGERILVATSDGELRLVDSLSTSRPRTLRVPDLSLLDREAFADVAGTGSHTRWFRVLDVAARDAGSGFEIFVSRHRWIAERSCFVVELVRSTLRTAFTPDDVRRSSWEPVYATRPCLPVVESEPSWPFRGMEGGGRIDFLGDDHVLLTVGDHGFNGFDFEEEPNLVETDSADYGKTLLIQLDDGTAEEFTRGHRNAQGLFVDQVGNVWSTEHGPQGGDELNLLVQGEHYGWPAVTYGTDYSAKAWPRNPVQGRHDGYREPRYAWVPSIGVSNLIRISSPRFGLWSGDLLVTSLVGRRIARVRLSENGVRMIEDLSVGARIRDVLQLTDGRIAFLTDGYGLMFMSPADDLFGACSGCHTLAAGASSLLGPHLAGVIGRPVASVDGFDYSEALRGLGGRWTEERLDAFIEDPHAFAPGTAMVFAGEPEPDVRRRIIEYLRAN